MQALLPVGGAPGRSHPRNSMYQTDLFSDPFSLLARQTSKKKTRNSHPGTNLSRRWARAWSMSHRCCTASWAPRWRRQGFRPACERDARAHRRFIWCKKRLQSRGPKRKAQPRASKHRMKAKRNTEGATRDALTDALPKVHQLRHVGWSQNCRPDVHAAWLQALSRML